MPRTILLVEDNPDDVVMITRVIQKTGIRNPIHQVSTITEAKRRLLDALPALLLLDLHLPDGSGLALLEWVRSQASPLHDLSVIVGTDSRSRIDEHRADLLGATLFLQKPMDPEVLAVAIRHFGLRQTTAEGGTIIDSIPSSSGSP